MIGTEAEMEATQDSGKSDESFEVPTATDAFEVCGHSDSDQATDQDTLGFQPYVEATAAFLLNPKTSTPLTVSIEGEWGSGKSSFMKQLRKALESQGRMDPISHDLAPSLQKQPIYTVWFNAWRHDAEDSLWAAFALLVTRQLRGQLGFLSRHIGDARLFKLRVSGSIQWMKILLATSFWWLLILLTSACLIEAIRGKGSDIASLLTQLTNDSNQAPTEAIISTLGHWQAHHWLAGVALALVGLLIWWRKTFSNPLEPSLERHLSRPEYKGRVAFIENFHDDFQRVLQAYMQSGRLFVFVDDLDRSDENRVVRLLKAISLMIGSYGQLVFILGMDREKVAALVTASLKDLAPYLAETEEYRCSSSLGFSYLEKFIQIPIRVPVPSFGSMDKFVSSICKIPEDLATSREFMGRAIRSRLHIVDVSFGSDSSEVYGLALMVAPTLGKNPRRIKQFINIFRLQAYIAASLGLLDYDETNADESGTENQILTVEQIAKFICITLCWPEVLIDISGEPRLINKLAEMAEGGTSDTVPSKVLQHWSTNTELSSLLKEGVIGFQKGWRYSLKAADLSRLLVISPRRTIQKLKSHAIFESPESDNVIGHGETEEEAWEDAAQRLKAAGHSPSTK
jgi:hypothetical protein